MAPIETFWKALQAVVGNVSYYSQFLLVVLQILLLLRVGLNDFNNDVIIVGSHPSNFIWNVFIDFPGFIYFAKTAGRDLSEKAVELTRVTHDIWKPKFTLILAGDVCLHLL